MQEEILDNIFLGPRKFEIVLTQCDDSNCTCGSYHQSLFWDKKLKKEYLFLKFVPILYCYILEKSKKYKTSTFSETGVESNHIVMKNSPSKTKQRFLEKSWITVEFGVDVFKYKHQYQRTFSMKDFVAIVQNHELLNSLGFDSFNDNCLKSLNQEICDHFCAKK